MTIAQPRAVPQVNAKDDILNRIQDNVLKGVRGAQLGLENVQAAIEAVAIRYSTASGQSLPNGATTIINFEAKGYDTMTAVVTGAGWTFTCPKGKDGIYAVIGAVSIIAGAVGGNPGFAALYKNAAPYFYGSQYTLAAAQSVILPFAGDVPIVAGDKLDIRVFHTSGVATLDSTLAAMNHISIHRLPGS